MKTSSLEFAVTTKHSILLIRPRTKLKVWFQQKSCIRPYNQIKFLWTVPAKLVVCRHIFPWFIQGHFKNLHNHKHKTITSCILGRKRSRTANVHPIKNGRKWSETKDHQVINIRQTFEDLEHTHAYAFACITDNNKYWVLSIRVKLLLAYLNILISSRKH